MAVQVHCINYHTARLVVCSKRNHMMQIKRLISQCNKLGEDSPEL